MFDLVITPKHDCALAKTKYNCDAIISIQDADEEVVKEVETPRGFSIGWHRHFFFDDLSNEYFRASKRHPELLRMHPPKKEDVKAILAFAKALSREPTCKRVLIHCFAGVSRSAACAVAIYSMLLGADHEEEAMQLAAKSAVYGGIWPNDLIIQFADDLLKRNGALEKAVKAWKDHEKGLAKGFSF